MVGGLDEVTSNAGCFLRHYRSLLQAVGQQQNSKQAVAAAEHENLSRIHTECCRSRIELDCVITLEELRQALYHNHNEPNKLTD